MKSELPLRNDSFPQRVAAFLASWREVTRALERTLVDNLAATSPWLAPVIPAYLAYRSMVDRLDFPIPIAVVGAVVVEFLGLSTVHTAFSLWDYNDSRRKTDQRAPALVAVLTAAGYLAVVLVVNVLLSDRSPVENLAIALLSLLTLISAVTLAIRANHARRVVDVTERKAEEKRERDERRHATHATQAELHGDHRAMHDASHDATHPLSYPRPCDAPGCVETLPDRFRWAAHQRKHRNGYSRKEAVNVSLHP